MDYKAVQIKNNVHASVKGVISAAFARQCAGGEWAIMIPQVAYSVPTEKEAVKRIARALGNWYTTAEAAAWLVKIGSLDKVTAHDVCLWARNSLLPGSVKITGKGGMGRGGSWRIPEATLIEFVKRREGQ